MSVRNVLAAILVGATACSRDDHRAPKQDTSSSGFTPESPAPGAASPVTRSSSYVGVRYDPMPAGVSYESGSVILGADGKPSRFVLSHVKTPSGSMTWLDEMLPDEGTTRRRIVRASMDDPGGNPDQHLVVGTCGVDGSFSGDVVALVYNTPAEKPGTVARAWRANPAGARFDVISTKGVVCDEPGG